MTSHHILIALAIIGIVIGGLLAISFINVALYRIDNAMMVIFAVLVLAAAVTATYLVTRSPDQEKYKG